MDSVELQSSTSTAWPVLSLGTGSSTGSSTGLRSKPRDWCVDALRGIVPAIALSPSKPRGSGIGVSSKVRQLNYKLEKAANVLTEDSLEEEFDHRRGSKRKGSKRPLPPAQQIEELGKGLDSLVQGVQSAGKSHADWNPLKTRNLEESQRKAKAAPKQTAKDKALVGKSRQQEKAMGLFEAIDVGHVVKNEVFSEIPNVQQRVATKTDYYRDRLALVIPQVEEGFMCKDMEWGQKIVDVGKVMRNASRKSMIGVLGEAMSSKHTDDLETTHHLMSTNSTTSRWSQAEHARRCLHAPKVKRNQNLDWRISALLNQQAKQERKGNAERDRVLLTWMVLAAATDTMSIVWSTIKEAKDEQNVQDVEEFAQDEEVADEEEEAYDNFDSGAVLSPKLKNHQHTTDFDNSSSPSTPSGKDRISQVAMRTSARGTKQKNISTRQLEVIMASMAHHEAAAQKAEYSEYLVKQWRVAEKVQRGRIRMLVPIQHNRYADMIKDFINQSWRGYEICRGVKRYLHNVHLIQRALTQSIVLKQLIRDCVLNATFWEIESTCLAELVGMPAEDLKAEIQYHFQQVGLEQRIKEAQTMLNWRDRIWRGEVKFIEAQTFLQKAQSFYRSVTVKNIKPDSPSKNSPAKMQHAKSPKDRKDLPQRHGAEPPSEQRWRGSKESSDERPRDLKASRSDYNRHPMMDVINKYRVPAEERAKILETAYQDGITRWSFQNSRYKERMQFWKREWDQWLMDISALGRHNRELWPNPPVAPSSPSELLRCDKEWFRKEILYELKRSEAGKLL